MTMRGITVAHMLPRFWGQEQDSHPKALLWEEASTRYMSGVRGMSVQPGPKRCSMFLPLDAGLLKSWGWWILLGL